MKRKLLLLCLVELVCGTIWGAVSTHLALDTRTTDRAISASGENLRYGASWYTGGKTATITDNGVEIVSGSVGVKNLRTTNCGEHCFELKVFDDAGSMVGTEEVEYKVHVGEFNNEVLDEPTRGHAGLLSGIKCSVCGERMCNRDEKIYVINVLARELQPWNGLVEISYELAENLSDEYNLEFYLVDKSLNETNLITKFVSDPPRTQGVHHILWKGREEFPNRKWDEVSFVAETSVGVQLWENGPYWAECNVGATKPEEYGYYFWWGDTKGYTHDGNQWNAVDGSRKGFEFSSSNCPTYGKSKAELQSAGYVNSSGNLALKYDAATKHWGAPWRMPTDAEFSALINKCDSEWTTRNGVAGRLVKGRGAYASKSIFLPAAGYGNGSELYGLSSVGDCWSSTPNSGNSGSAWDLYFNSGNFNRNNYYYYLRDLGQSVRPLRGFAP